MAQLTTPKEITVNSAVIRHNPQFSRLVTIVLDQIEPWELSETTTVEGTIKETNNAARLIRFLPVVVWR
jgi:hypothetical protein